MKQYDRETKSWLTPEEIARKRGKRKMCKGGREHDWIETLPEYGVEALPNYTGNVNAYHEAEAKIQKYIDRVYEELEKDHGIKVKWARFRRDMKHYTCSVCLKNKRIHN